MMRFTSFIITILISMPCWADEYSFETGLAYNAERQSRTSFFSSPGGQQGSSTIDFDSDTLALTGAWYFDRVEQQDGPRSRAAFLTRASSLSASLQFADGDQTFSSSPSGGLESEASSFAVDLRYLLPESDWFGLASAGTSNLEFDSRNSVAPDGENDATFYGVGIGTYVRDTTTVELRYLVVDTTQKDDGIQVADFTERETALAVSHIGELNPDLYFGTDVSVSLLHDDAADADGRYSVSGALYRGRDLAFGADISGKFGSDGADNRRYGLFASWFASENLELRANYQLIDNDEPASTDIDEHSIGLSANLRF